MKLEELEELGALIAKARKKKGWLQADLAEAAKVSQQTVSNIEQGKVGKIDSIKSVAAAVGLEVSLVVKSDDEGAA
jgi:HTH-type transcriptional regulator / antitoxin HipB